MKEGIAMQYQNLSVEEQVRLVRENPSDIQYIKHPSEEVQLEAVNNNRVIA